MKPLLSRRLKLEPIAYITNYKDFWKSSFYVDSRVLIPRPETEIIIEDLQKSYDPEKPSLIADIGCGSGCLAISLAAEFKESKVIATDKFPGPLQVTEINRKKINTPQVFLIQADSLSAFKSEIFDIIVSNPPYIKTSAISELEKNVRDFEPLAALDGGEEGFSVIAPLLKQTYMALKPGGLFYMEFGDGQVEAICKLVSELPKKLTFTILKDYAEKERILKLKKG